ncbi:hypothetical protein [Dyadobacter frigoris]|uniref:Lipoprotein n=1 Tax=Dyadobacter frigoris TaxID=2576211 RepID=A0A4U6DC84_9BACT|nr:hypothetical protein [Dyadobacter frigoris]TKT94101.1 hypothetical protein FDK13_02505 [Dyadobacter frigoris]GLU50688.1 hypothetical protein Dfri01_01490 [Dyadobacter frigoris]
MKIIMHIFFFTLLLSGCIDCGPQKELTIRLSIDADTFLLKKVTAPGAIDLSIFDEQVKNYTSHSYSQLKDFTFPISLNADSTTYIFEFENRTDTLTLFYARDFSYKNGCGFVVDAKYPNSSFETKSTFKYVHVDYQSYILDEKIRPFGTSEGPGISIEASL